MSLRHYDWSTFKWREKTWQKWRKCQVQSESKNRKKEIIIIKRKEGRKNKTCILPSISIPTHLCHPAIQSHQNTSTHPWLSWTYRHTTSTGNPAPSFSITACETPKVSGKKSQYGWISEWMKHTPLRVQDQGVCGCAATGRAVKSDWKREKVWKVGEWGGVGVLRARGWRALTRSLSPSRKYLSFPQNTHTHTHHPSSGFCSKVSWNVSSVAGMSSGRLHNAQQTVM